MRQRKRLYDAREHLSAFGMAWHRKVEKTITPVVKAAVKANISMLDLEMLIYSVAGFECAMANAGVNADERKPSKRSKGKR